MLQHIVEEPLDVDPVVSVVELRALDDMIETSPNATFFVKIVSCRFDPHVLRDDESWMGLKELG